MTHTLHLNADLSHYDCDQLVAASGQALLTLCHQVMSKAPEDSELQFEPTSRVYLDDETNQITIEWEFGEELSRITFGTVDSKIYAPRPRI